MTTATSPQVTPQPTWAELNGGAIRTMRRAHNVTQEDLAKRVGIKQSHLSRVERGERLASAGLRERIADVIAGLPVPAKGEN